MKGTILTKLTVDKDRRQFESSMPKVGKFKLLRYIYSSNSTEFLKLNLLFLIFSMPLFFVLMYFPSYFRASVASKYNFIGNIGFGFPGTTDSLVDCKLELYDKYFYVVLMIAAAIIILGIGVAGMMAVCRNFVWGVPTKVGRDFFKGIKNYGLYTILFFIIYAALFIGGGAVVLWNMKLMARGADNFGSWLCVVLVGIAAVYVVINSLHLLPMINCYKFNLGTLIKNSNILTITLLPVGFGVSLLLLIPIALGIWVNILSLIVVMLMVMFGFSIYALIWTIYGQYSFEMTIKPLYESKLKQENTKVKKIKKNTANKNNNNKKA